MKAAIAVAVIFFVVLVLFIQGECLAQNEAPRGVMLLRFCRDSTTVTDSDMWAAYRIFRMVMWLWLIRPLPEKLKELGILVGPVEIERHFAVCDPSEVNLETADRIDSLLKAKKALVAVGGRVKEDVMLNIFLFPINYRQDILDKTIQPYERGFAVNVDTLFTIMELPRDFESWFFVAVDSSMSRLEKKRKK